MKIIDTHVHLIKMSYQDKLDEVIQTTKDKEVMAINVPLGVKSSLEVLELYKTHKHLLPTVGIHPDFINRFKEEDLKAIDDMITPDVVAIAEIGLDYHRNKGDNELQKHIFISQIEIAIKHNLPVVIHVLDAHDDLLKIVEQYPQVKFLMHCWAGTVEQTKLTLSFGDNIYFGFGGEITTTQKEEHRTWEVPDRMRETIKLIPKDRLVLETDCPGLTPDPYRSNGEDTNYPWYIYDVATYVAKHLDMDEEELIELSNNNAKEFYNLK